MFFDAFPGHPPSTLSQFPAPGLLGTPRAAPPNIQLYINRRSNSCQGPGKIGPICDISQYFAAYIYLLPLKTLDNWLKSTRCPPPPFGRYSLKVGKRKEGEFWGQSQEWPAITTRWSRTYQLVPNLCPTHSVGKAKSKISKINLRSK